MQHGHRGAFKWVTEDAPVLDRPAPLRRLHDSGAGYKYSDLLLTYLLTYLRILALSSIPLIQYVEISSTLKFKILQSTLGPVLAELRVQKLFNFVKGFRRNVQKKLRKCVSFWFSCYTVYTGAQKLSEATL